MKKSILSPCALFFCTSPVSASDLYDPTSATLAVPSLVIGEIEYLNVRATLGPVTVLSIGDSSVPSAANALRVPPAMPATDRFDPGTNILAVPELMIGSIQFRNLRVRLGSVSVQGVGGSVLYFEPPPSPGP